MDRNVALEVRDLSFSYEPGKKALDGVSFAVAAGERVGLVGPNGAGKSTLILCINGVLQGFQGTISVAGLSPARKEHLPRIRKIVGTVLQSSEDQLFNPTVLEDVAFGPRNLGATREQAAGAARSALELVGIPPGLYACSPHGLSAGQKRRAAVAGVLAMNPKILLLDEPASDLDPRGKDDLLSVLARLDGTQIIAAHDLELIRRTCRRVIVLESGRVVGQGPPDAILRDRELMESHGLEVPFSLQCCRNCSDMIASRSSARTRRAAGD